MKIVILAGGLGTRLAEETEVKPKPMVEIGGMPVLWHIMKIYSAHGMNDFIVCLGYKGYVIKEFFANYFLHRSDVTIDFATNGMTIHEHYAEPWKVTLVDTGAATMTGGRLKRIEPYLDGETFGFTYGDGLSDVHIGNLLEFHRRQGKLATVTAAYPPGRFGRLQIENESVIGFQEKPEGDGEWINGGFFFLEPPVLRYLDDDETVWERQPLEALARDGQLAAYKHFGFWQPMDTLREKILLEQYWASEKAPWKVW